MTLTLQRGCMSHEAERAIRQRHEERVQASDRERLGEKRVAEKEEKEEKLEGELPVHPRRTLVSGRTRM